MSNNKQSSVEWFMENANQLNIHFLEGRITQLVYAIKKVRLQQQAKEMHKEEMVDFGNDLLAQNDINYIGMPNLAEQYYNETFGGDK